jgi:FkbH-like protein
MWRNRHGLIKKGKMTYAEIQEKLEKVDFTGLKPVNISILRNIIVEPIEPYLRYFAMKSGLNCHIKFGDYDNIFHESLGVSSDLINKELDSVLVFLKLEALSWNLARNFTGLSKEQINNEIGIITENTKKTLAGIRQKTNAIVLWSTFEIPIYPGLGIQDSQAQDGQLATIRELNETLCRIFRNIPGVYALDMNLCIARVGGNNFYDQRYWHIGRAPYTREALSEIGWEIIKYIRPLKGKNKKCLVLDCDNTLWGGIVGEDGIAGIKLGKSHPGSAFCEFQQEVVNYYNRGVIIALCSKNNEDDVWEVFSDHPDMVLKRKHIAAARINWGNKVANLKQIAQELNIGLDSIVFVDDSDFEINLVREKLPEVHTIHLRENETVKYRDNLAALGLFDTLEILTEDKKRGEMYKVEVTRKKLKEDTTDLESYLSSLEAEVEISFADEFSIPRIVQQIQKTNQFNLTTRRYNRADIEKFVGDKVSDVICLRLLDRFGDYGIVGTCVLKYIETQAVFDIFLLSCRIIGHGVEGVFLAEALKLAKMRGCKTAVGEYYATKKNSQVEYFYKQYNFKELVVENNSKGNRKFLFKLSDKVPEPKNYFKSIVSVLKK